MALDEKTVVIDHMTTSLEPGADPAVTALASGPEVIELAEDDDDNPQNWPVVTRWAIVIAASLMTMISLFSTNVITPSAPQILADFHVSDDLYRTLLVSIWELGEGVGPFIAAPLSEYLGRAPVFHSSNLLGLVCILACALSTNISMLVAFRFLGGFFLNAPTLSPAIIGDVIHPRERGKAMAIGVGLRQMGLISAPIVGAFINQGLGWRWTQWILAIAIGVFGVVALLVVKETYAVKILRKKTKRLRESHPKLQGLSSAADAEKTNTASWKAMIRPVQILFSSLAVFVVSVYTGLMCGILVLVYTTLTPIMEENYNFSEGAVGLSYVGTNIGCVVAIVFYLFTSDRYLEYKKRQEGSSRPEHRLVHMLIGSVTLPLGLLLYGWTALYKVQFVVPLLGTAIFGFSLALVILPSENYLVDAHEEFSASACAACMIMRSILGAVFPLIGPPLYGALGLGWGNSLLALISAVFIPLLALLIKRSGWQQKEAKQEMR